MAVSAVSTDDGRASLVAALNNGSSTSATTTSEAQEMSDRFLKLLVTQLKNQDPMNPMENAELTSQLAQMSTVEGISKLNTTLSEMSRTSQMAQGASLVGRTVLAEGDNLELTDSGAVGGINLDFMADSVEVTIFDASGNAIRVLDLGKQEGGLVRFVWDGKDAGGTLQENGSYSFSISATAADAPVNATVYGLGKVLSVSLNDTNEMDVEVSGMGILTLDKIKQVY